MLLTPPAASDTTNPSYRFTYLLDKYYLIDKSSSNIASGISTVQKTLVLLPSIMSGQPNKCSCGQSEAQEPLEVYILFRTSYTSGS